MGVLERGSGTGEGVALEREWHWRGSGTGEGVALEREWHWRGSGTDPCVAKGKTLV